jgi:hypothetical protein
MSAHFEDGDDVIGVLIRFQVKDQRRESEDAQGGRAKDSAFQARRGAIAQDFLRRPRRVVEIIRQVIEKSLNPGRSFKRAQRAQLRARETETVNASHKGRKGHDEADARAYFN